MKKKIPVILCVDTGIDDVVGIALAINFKQFEVKLIVCDQGNSSIENTTTNTLGVLDILSAPNIPVVKGKLPESGKFICNAHGKNGLAEYTFEHISRQAIQDSSDDVIYNIAKENSKVDIIQLGPSTSTASALKKYPDLKNYINRIVIMGGSKDEKLDTVNPYQEFNVASDPESAEFVINSGIDILMVPSEMGLIGKLDYYDIYKTKNMNSSGNFIEKIYRGHKHRRLKSGIATCDATAVVAAAYPEVFEIKPVYGFIKYFEHANTGVCLYDYTNKSPNIQVCTNINIKKFKKLYFKTIKRLP